jgi:hypothetical protein
MPMFLQDTSKLKVQKGSHGGHPFEETLRTFGGGKGQLTCSRTSHHLLDRLTYSVSELTLRMNPIAISYESLDIGSTHHKASADINKTWENADWT